MADRSFDVQQNIFKSPHPLISVSVFFENNLTEAALSSFLDTVGDGVVGLAPVYGSKCRLSVLALASLSKVLIIRLSSLKSTSRSKGKKKDENVSSHRELLKNLILWQPAIIKQAFQMDKVATALFSELGLRIMSGIDLLSLSNAGRHSLQASMDVLGGEETLNKPSVIQLFKLEENANTPIKVTALQAWAACRIATLPTMAQRLAKSSRIDTDTLPRQHLDVIAKTIRDANRLTALKPTRVKNDVQKDFSVKQGKLQVESSRYKSKVMVTAGHQSLQIETAGTGKRKVITGKVTKVDGRAATISLNSSFSGASIRSITTIGREVPTSAEDRRASIMLQALQQRITLFSEPFVQSIWLPGRAVNWKVSPTTSATCTLNFSSPRPLNESQKKAVNAILSNADADRVVLIQGPPGTGKTTVLAASVTSVMSSSDRSRTMWLVAESNVAVRNIAEKLADINFLDFKILVSKNFHHDWHEHLYPKVTRNLIRSDEFVDTVVQAERKLLGSRVILCTLSMLANERLGPFVRLVPPQTLIFDEASQIEIGDYFPMLSRFRSTIRKLVFVGDDKQLAPFGQGDIEDLQSIFEMNHLRKRSVFLDTQYRMPVTIGTFISNHVYNGLLKSVHSITSPTSCRFINVSNGVEKSHGHSWTNSREVQVAIKLARELHRKEKSFRIITPYDAQRSVMENELKNAKLPWEDKCFNIDSFQGNEDDFIIISLVRSVKMGFLKETRRVNVMLTRCKKGMFICTSRSFVKTIAAESLVGILAESLGEQTWVEASQVLSGNFGSL